MTHEVLAFWIWYPVIGEPPLLDGAVQPSVSAVVFTAVEVGFVGAPGTVLPVAAWISTATSSQPFELTLLVQVHVADPGVATVLLLDAPVMVLLDTLTFHSLVHVGFESWEPPKIEGESSIQLLAYWVVMDMVGLPEAAEFVLVVGIGLVWLTPVKAYAPTTASVVPAMVTTMFAVPLGFLRYQNSVSSFVKWTTAWVRDVVPNLTEVAPWLSDSIPTTSSKLLPVPTLKLESVMDDDDVACVVCTLLSVIPPCALASGSNGGRFNGNDCNTGTRSSIVMTKQLAKNLEL